MSRDVRDQLGAMALVPFPRADDARCGSNPVRRRSSGCGGRRATANPVAPKAKCDTSPREYCSRSGTFNRGAGCLIEAGVRRRHHRHNEAFMYHHVKKLMYTVRVDEPDPRFGNMLLEQFGGANGELAAAMQYSIQGLNCEDPERKDLLMDIGTEELSHLEIVGCLARMHLKPMKFAREEAEADPLIAIAGGGGVNLFNSMGNPWTAD
jgi:hypothetical protein